MFGWYRARAGARLESMQPVVQRAKCGDQGECKRDREQRALVFYVRRASFHPRRKCDDTGHHSFGQGCF